MKGLFKRAAEDIFNTPMGNTPNEEKATDRVTKWIIIGMLIGGGSVVVGWLLGLLF